MELLKEFSLDTCVLNADQKRQLQKFSVEHHDMFAKDRFDVGLNPDLKIKVTPEHPVSMNAKGPSAPIHLGDEILVELPLLQCSNILTTLSHFKWSSPIVVHRKSFGKLRILIDLRRLHHLVRHDYINSNFLISNLTDVRKPFAFRCEKVL